MIDLEKLLKRAKPVVPDLPEGFNSSVMQKIVCLDSTTDFTTERTPKAKLQFGTGILALLFATVLFNFNTYEIRMNGSLELLYFGRQYFIDFIRYLPFDLLIASILLTTLSIWMFRKSGIIKRGIASLAIISYLVTGVGGSSLAAVGLNDQIESKITENQDRWSWLTIFQHSRARQFIHHPTMKLGKVERLINGKAELVTPTGEKLLIALPPDTNVEIGQFLRTSGIDKKAVFSANKVHICNPSRVSRYFGQMKHHQKMMKSCCKNRRKWK